MSSPLLIASTRRGAVFHLELRSRAETLAEDLARIPSSAYRRMKELLHAQAEERIRRALSEDPFVDIWFEEETRRAMGAARERLLAKREKGGKRSAVSDQPEQR